MGYLNTLILVSEDTKATKGIVPPVKNKKTVAQIEYEIISESPYSKTQEDIQFECYLIRNNFSFEHDSDLLRERDNFFSKPRACFRSSPLVKNYGWGMHYDEDGKINIYGMETEEYQEKIKDETIKKINGMRSKRI